MNAPVVVIAVLALLGAPAEKKEPPVVVRVVAAQACTVGHPNGVKKFDPGIEEIRAAVADLEFDTYHLVKAADLSAPHGEETKLVVNDRYSLFLTPVAKDKSGRVKLAMRVEMAPKDKTDKPVNVLVTTLLAAPGKPFNLRGMKLDQGELVIVLRVAPM